MSQFKNLLAYLRSPAILKRDENEGEGKSPCSVWTDVKNKLHQYKAQLSLHFLYVAPLETFFLCIAWLPLFAISLSSPSLLTLFVISGVH